MDTSSWRVRVMLEPRGFIRILELILAIVAFATTGGYSGQAIYSIICPPTPPGGATAATPLQPVAKITYPFRLSAHPVEVSYCNGNKTTVTMDGDLSPSAQWFVFVGVTAFLYSLASVVFYVVFDSSVRLTHDRLVTIGDLAITVLFTFFWLTAASAWAWGLGQVKLWSGSARFLVNSPLDQICKGDGVTCREVTGADFSPLNASVAFAFLNFVLWGSNLWFVYKESPYHQEPGKDDGASFPDASAPPNNM